MLSLYESEWFINLFRAQDKCSNSYGIFNNREARIYDCEETWTTIFWYWRLRFDRNPWSRSSERKMETFYFTAPWVSTKSRSASGCEYGLCRWDVYLFYEQLNNGIRQAVLQDACIMFGDTMVNIISWWQLRIHGVVHWLIWHSNHSQIHILW